MAKRGRRSNHRGRQGEQDRRRRQPQPARASLAPARRRRTADLLTEVGRRLASGEPVDFLAYASTLVASLDPRGRDPFEGERAGQIV